MVKNYGKLAPCGQTNKSRFLNDLRLASPSFGRSLSAELKAEKTPQLVIGMHRMKPILGERFTYAMRVFCRFYAHTYHIGHKTTQKAHCEF